MLLKCITARVVLLFVFVLSSSKSFQLLSLNIHKKEKKKGWITVAHIYSEWMLSAGVHEKLVPAMSPKMILRTTFPSNMLMVDVYLN